MLDLRLNRRRPSERFRTSATKFVGRLESLESRIVLNGAVGVPSQFVSFLAHPFEITSIPQDADNDGIIGTQTVTFDGVFGRTGTISGGHGTTLTLEAVQQGAAIGSFTVASGTASPVNFSFSNTTPLVSGLPVTFRVNAYGQTAGGQSRRQRHAVDRDLHHRHHWSHHHPGRPARDDRLWLGLHGRCHLL